MSGRAALRRLVIGGAVAGAVAVLWRPGLFRLVGVESLLGGAAPPRRAFGRDLALQPGIISAGCFQRAFGDGALGAFALDRRIELLDALFRLGVIGRGFGLEQLDPIGQRLDLVLGVAERAVARLDGFRQHVAAVGQRQAGLLELLVLTVMGLVGAGELLGLLFRAAAAQHGFHQFGFDSPDFLGARHQALA